RTLDQCPARSHNHVTIGVGVVHFHESEVRRLQRVILATIEVTLLPRQSLLPKLRRFLIHLVDNSLECALQMRRLIYLKHELPRRYRKKRTIDGEGKLTTQRRSDVVTNVEPARRRLLIKCLSQVWRDRFQHAKQ